ncbi:zinc finger, CCHC-type containing protein [Tanacetum coccineum]|uniref:Zinc finger, CCHC-type containing protein n=1 Tax=Tanacetum coccineum TaxID=301880 RepID=A0ABQ4WGM1_9ASTR
MVNTLTTIKTAYQMHVNNLLDVGCLMLATMALELQVNYIDVGAFDLINKLYITFQTQARTEERLDHAIARELAIDFILNSLSKEYKQFILNYNMHNVEGRIVAELHNMLKTAKRGIEQKLKNVLGVANRMYGKNICLWKGRGGKGKKNNYSKKVFNGFKPIKGVLCYKCGKEGHWSRTCPNGPAKKDKENTAKTSY